MKLETQLIDESTLITDPSSEGFRSTYRRDDVEREVGWWSTEQEAREGHGRLLRILTASISQEGAVPG